MLGAGSLFLSALIVQGQSISTAACSEELTKSDGDNHRIRISTGVSEGMIQRRVLPDTTDLKGSKGNSTVVVRVLIDKKGAVRCADAEQGDPSLFERSVEAAKQWRFRPFLLNSQPIIAETPIEFVFKKGKVKAR